MIEPLTSFKENKMNNEERYEQIKKLLPLVLDFMTSNDSDVDPGEDMYKLSDTLNVYLERSTDVNCKFMKTFRRSFSKGARRLKISTVFSRSGKDERICEKLNSAEIYRVEDLLNRSITSIKNIPGIGNTTFKYIENKIDYIAL